jgi:FMN phosphatase YigB (HAD superfamily)
MESEGGFRLYKDRRLALLREAVRSCGEFTDDHLEQAFYLEGRSHFKVWCDEHRTLPTAERLGKVLTHLKVCLPEDVTAELVRVYEEGILEHPPVLVPGVREALDRFSRRYRLGIISDVGYSPGRVLKQLLGQAGILSAFDSLIFSDEAGHSKPHVEVFERTARALEALPREIVHIGDLERTDIEGAKRAGYHAIRFTGVTPMEAGEKSQADRVTADFYEIPRLVESLL